MVMNKKRGKKLFTGEFNFSREAVKKHAWAFSGRQAKIFMMRQIADDHDVSYMAVAKIFDGSKSNFDIHVDEQWKERQNAKMQEL